MHPREPSPLSVGPGPPLLAACAAAATAAALWHYRADVAARLPAPLDDLVRGPGFLTQAAFVGVLTLIVAEALVLGRRRAAVTNLTADDRTSWAARHRLDARTASHPRPSRAQREDNLRRRRDGLLLGLNLRWLGYAALALLPAVGGLVVSRHAARVNAGVPLTFAEVYAPLFAGSAQTLLLWLLGGVVRLRARSMMGEWLAKSIDLERPPPVPPPEPEPAPPPPEPRRAMKLDFDAD